LTISQVKQLENLELAFTLAMAEVADKSIEEAFFDPATHPFDQILPTTWKELSDQQWVQERELYGTQRFQLTGTGWQEGLWRAGDLSKTAVREKLGRLAAALKAHVDGRQSDITVELSTVVREASLDRAWIFNVIDSNLRESVHGTRSARWDVRGLLIKIPLNFGLPLVDHAADLRSQLQNTQEELVHVQEELSEYRCPMCGAPLTARDDVQLSEDDSGTVVVYECGRIDSDGPGSRPCPSDPRFPRFEDYELRFIEQPNEGFWKWSCIAVGKTPAAKAGWVGNQTRQSAVALSLGGSGDSCGTPGSGVEAFLSP
jgi:hypothetical protein